ncbi:uncharacterized protein MELLADRAFT_85878 [Melampsora larici-populina 98AG31]|uniref:Uncharacterized protein n=1 Tax=Melampsora larici-populina (strain 98AG31 / pathotype 3-4-7) TaxID=747676 RepID=F4SDG8_MELLP|nr:uncharacterized protein MELLADRAFT_85878 [Melampsora larici-populina 98AG31]EGF97308.1 hypothetical protein MELLADRAFT_85878 [Melampsora larici-populina 98AG31]
MDAVEGEQQMLNMSLVTLVITVTGDTVMQHIPKNGQSTQNSTKPFIMSQGGSAPYDYSSHGNGAPPFRGPLNPNDHSLNQYNIDSFMPRDSRFDPYSGPSNPAGHRSSTTLPQRFPNPNRHQSNPTQLAPLPVFDTLATQASLNTENREHARICSNRLENDPRLNALLVYTAQCHQDIVQRLNQISTSHPAPSSASNSTSTTSGTVWQPTEELKSIGDPTLQAYTITKGVISTIGEKRTLTHSLEMILQIRLQRQDTAWKTRNFLPGSTTRFPKDLITFIKKRLKIVRENLHNLLRHNASPNRGFVENPLPTLQNIYLSLLTECTYFT